MDHLQFLKVVVDDGKGTALINFDRPAKLNAFPQAMIDEIVSLLKHLDANDAVRAVVITGGVDGHFCAGMDLGELVQITTSKAHAISFLKDLTGAFARFSKPIIAAVIGVALGGGFEIALACDMIYAAQDAKFGLPEVKIGTIPGAGGTQRLTRALGKHKAMELLLTGDSLRGDELERLGVINKAVPKADVIPAALALAERIANLSRPVTKTIKEAVLFAENTGLEQGMTHESSLYYSTFSLNDFSEGVGAFLEKRAPRFSHS